MPLFKRYALLLALPSIGCAILCTLVWAATVYKLDQSRTQLDRRFVQDAAVSAAAYARNVARAIEQIEQYTGFVQYEWARAKPAFEGQTFLEHHFAPQSADLTTVIRDKDGIVVTGKAGGKTDGKAAPPREAEARDFQFHKDQPAPSLHIARGDGGTIYFSRSLQRADGSFDGVIGVAVRPGYFTALADKLGMGTLGLRALFDSDGSILAATIGGAVVGRDTVWATAEAPAGSPSPENGFSDHKKRFIGRAAVGAYPLTALSGVAEADMLALYRDNAAVYQDIAITVTCLLLLATAIATGMIAQIVRRRRLREEERHTYRVATDGANEAFAIFRAMRDAAGLVNDFLVVDCNEHGAAYLGLSRTDALRRTLSSFYAESGNNYFQLVMSQLRHAMAVGFYEDEYKLPPESPIKTGWLNRRFVRTGDGLAMTLRDITTSKAHQHELARIANEDALTGLPNRHSLIHFLPMALARAHENKQSLALFFIDLDNFKNVNDTLGHAAGDGILAAVAQRLKSVLRASDYIARQGGDEFTVILEQIGDEAEVAQIAAKMLAALAGPLDMLDAGHTISASIGISLFPKHGMTADTLLKNADIAMYHAKFAGKGDYCFYRPSLSESLTVRLNSERALQRALTMDQFVLAYQPRVDTVSGEMLSMEALVRWVHPERGLVTPLEFIPLAEETGLILPLGEIVLEQACAQQARWQAQGLPVVPISINVSPRQFSDGDIKTSFLNSLARHGLAPNLIEIEVTESLMMGVQHEITLELSAIRALGIKLLVDDFGTGYSSLSQLLRLEMDVLKVDRSFTAELGRKPEGVIFFKAIVSMAHALGMTVVAEGVETAQQLRLLRELECDEVQGFYIARPQGPEQIPALLLSRYLLDKAHEQAALQQA